MSEEGAITATTPPVTATPSAPVTQVADLQPAITSTPVSATTEFDAHQYIDKNGDFLPGWKEKLIDPSQWKEGFYDQVKGVKGLLKTALDTKKMMGKKTIVPLSDNSTSEEIAAFRQAHGITGKYNYTPAKDIELVDNSPEGATAVLAEFDKAHYTQKQVDVAMGLYSKSIQDLQQAIVANDKAEYEEAERIIRTEAGSDENYQNKLHLANRVIDENTANWPVEKQTKFLEAINESPLKPFILDFIATVGNKFVEHKLIADMEASLGPADLEALIHEEMQKPEYLKKDHPAHKLQVAKVQKMFQEREDRKNKMKTAGII